MDQAPLHQEDKTPKYRYLTDDELQHLEEELKQFLIVNQVHAREWEEINQQQPEVARKLVALFSDQVLQRVYEKVEFLERRTIDSLFVFRFMQAAVHLIVLQLPEKNTAGLSFETTESIHEVLRNHAAQLRVFKSQKPYHESREMEIHRLLEQGAIASNAAFWQALETLI